MSSTDLNSMPPASHLITAGPTSLANGSGVANTTGVTGFDQCPLEICREILDYLSHDLAALKACSLTCRAWLPIVRSHLFYVFDLTYMVTKRVPFYSFLVENPDIAACARVSRVLNFHYLVQFLPLLVNVQEVKVCTWRCGEEKPRDVQWSFPLVKSLTINSINEWTFYHANVPMIQSVFPGLSTFALSLHSSSPSQLVESSGLEMIRGLRVDELILDSNSHSGLKWIIPAVKFSRLNLTVDIQHADTARCVTALLLNSRFVMGSLTLRFWQCPPWFSNSTPDDIGAAFAHLDASHDTRARCLTLLFDGLDGDRKHAGNALLDTRSSLLSNFSSSILEKIELTFGLWDDPESIQNRISPFEGHLVRLARERPGLKVVVRVKQRMSYENENKEEQGKMVDEMMAELENSLDRLRACRPGVRLLLETATLRGGSNKVSIRREARFE